MMRFDAELTAARAAASIAAELLVAGAGRENVREKGRADLVTAVDIAAENAIIGRIRDDFPDDSIVAEESASAEKDGRRWIIDPLDGTVNFVHGHPFACVSIGLVDDEGPAVGVISAPFLAEEFTAVRGGGAFLNGRPLRVSRVAELSEALLATGFPFKPGKGDPQSYFRLVADLVTSTHGIRRAGAAALDLAYVAAGRVDAFFEIGLAQWDIAAGLLIVTEAGGRTSGWPGHEVDPLATGSIIASNSLIHDQLARTLSNYHL